MFVDVSERIHIRLDGEIDDDNTKAQDMNS